MVLNHTFLNSVLFIKVCDVVIHTDTARFLPLVITSLIFLFAAARPKVKPVAVISPKEQTVKEGETVLLNGQGVCGSSCTGTIGVSHVGNLSAVKKI